MYKWNQMDPSGFIWFHLYTVRVTDLYGSIMTFPKEPTESLDFTLRTTDVAYNDVLFETFMEKMESDFAARRKCQKEEELTEGLIQCSAQSGVQPAGSIRS